MRIARLASITAVALLLAASTASCGDSDGRPADPETAASGDTPADAALSETPDDDAEVRDTVGEDTEVDGDGAPDTSDGEDGPLCDPIMPQSCVFPWPSSVYLRPDATRVTGRTLSFGEGALPANRGGQAIPFEPWERLDGYTPGTSMLAILGDVDDSRFAGERDVGASLDPESPIVLLETRDGETRRVAHWAEWTGRQPDLSLRTLVVRPAEVLRENTDYIVVFRELQMRDGSPFQRSEAFARLVAGDTADDPVLAARQPQFDRMLETIEATLGRTDDLSVAWEFHTASHEALHGPLLRMRDDALAGGPPTFRIDAVREFVAEPDESGRPVDAEIALEIEGTFEVPWYLESETVGGRTGMVIARDEEGRPRRNGTRERPFWVMVPHSAVGGEPPLLVQYGHGLLSSGSQVFADYNRRVAADHGFVYFSATLTGMSRQEEDVAMYTATDAGRFPWLAEPLHQGLVEWVLLGHHLPKWIAEQPVFTDRSIASAPGSPAYSGISQGGIFGLTYVALSPDVSRGHMGVPGNDYATLLERSVDFTGYLAITGISYPLRHEQVLWVTLIGMLWESTDPVSWVRHISAEPVDGGEPNSVLLAPAKNDPQVAVVTNEVIARTVDADIPLMADYGRDVFGADEAPYPRTGSGIVLYDFGHPWPEPGMHPPQEYPELGDPHSLPKHTDHHNEQLAHFLWTGEVIDVCGGDGCTPN